MNFYFYINSTLFKTIFHLQLFYRQGGYIMEKPLIEQHMEQYSLYLLKLAFMYVKDRQITEDIVQEVFVQFYYSHHYNEQGNLKSYLTTMTVNRSKNYLTSWSYRIHQLDKKFEEIKQYQTGNFTAQVESIYTMYGEFEIILREDKERFANKNIAVNKILLSTTPTIGKIQQQEKLGYICYLTLDAYIKGAQKLGTHSDESTAAQDLAELLIILKNSVELY